MLKIYDTFIKINLKKNSVHLRSKINSLDFSKIGIPTWLFNIKIIFLLNFPQKKNQYDLYCYVN